MFNPEKGRMIEGIGHYTAQKTGEKEMTVTCDNPYPCQFDKGIVASAAEKFKPAGAKVTITEEDATACRANGGKSCTFKVRW